MKLTTEQRNGIAVVAVAGEVDASSVSQFRAHLDDLLVQGGKTS